MSVDLKTLLLLVAVSDVAVAIVLAAGAGRRLRFGIAGWIGSLLVRALAIGVLVARLEPQAAVLVVSAALLALSISFQASAMLSYDGRRFPEWAHAAVMAALAIPFTFIGTDAVDTVIFGGLVFGVLLAVLGAIALQIRPTVRDRTRARTVLAITYAIGSFGFLSRALSAMMSAEPLQAFTSPTTFQSATFVAAAVASIVSTFGFLMLHKERSDGEAVRLATIDPLTGAYNRRTFHDIAERELGRARRGGQPLSIIIVDIDHFRPVNEQHGNHTGDEVLRRVADLIRGALRKEDMLVRYGGEEFLVMLPEVPGPGAVIVAGRIRKSVEAETIQVQGKSLQLTVSVGVSARLDEGPESIENLLTRADEALALAKQRGRNRVVALSLGRSIAA
ncbi:MAG TPA: GGDEF domain-containing protein [Usitatibacter sp.]|nr:GGDEF domain-containing protein [Usitatibacter sp.]